MKINISDFEVKIDMGEMGESFLDFEEVISHSLHNAERQLRDELTVAIKKSVVSTPAWQKYIDKASDELRARISQLGS